MGTPDFAAASLRALLASDRHEVVCVVSQPDRRAGRGKRTVAPPVAQLAREAALPLAQPEGGKAPGGITTRAFRAWLGGHEPDVTVVAAFGRILGPRLLAVPPRGSLNVHASLLPRWRGAAPIQAALLAGDPETGVCIMQMEAGLDTGPVLVRRATAITDQDTGETLHDRLAALGAQALLETLDALEGPAPPTPTPQDDARHTYAPTLRKADGDLDWTQPAAAVARRIRALHPWPGTRTRWAGQWLKLLPPARVATQTASHAAAAGEVLGWTEGGLLIATGATGDGDAVEVGRLQAPGKRALDAAAFRAGQDLPTGTRLGDAL